ncbi:MAG: hypothetical protein V4607_10230 [Pseudomonadota bacterium]
MRNALCGVLLLACAGQAQANCSLLPSAQQVDAQDQLDRTVRGYATENALREFALYAYRSIANDVVNGYGPYLETIHSQFAFTCSEPAAFTAWLRVILVTSPSVADFSRHLVVGRELARQAAFPAERKHLNVIAP